MRGAAYALRAGTVDARASGAAIDTVFALSSVLTPFALGAVIGGDRLAGACRSATPPGDLFSSWLNPTSIADRRARGRDSAPTSRPCSSPPTPARRGDRASCSGRSARARSRRARSPGSLAVAGLVVLRSDARCLYDGLLAAARSRP